MILKVFGWASLIIGLLFLIGAPGDRAQMKAYGNMGRLLGIALIIIGILMIKL